MATIDFYSYKGGETTLNSLHPTLKIILITIVSIKVTKGSLLDISYYLFFTSLSLKAIHRSFKPLFGELKYLIFLFISLGIFQSLGGFPVTEALALAGIYTLRIGVIINLGSLFITTTYPGDISGGIYRIIRIKKLSEMISLSIKIIPSFIISWHRIHDSLKSRGLYLIKNPFRFLKSLTLPLIVETFRKSDAIAASMESRSYNGWVEIPIKNRGYSIRVILLSTLPLLLQIGMPLLQDLLAFFFEP